MAAAVGCIPPPATVSSNLVRPRSSSSPTWAPYSRSISIPTLRAASVPCVVLAPTDAVELRRLIIDRPITADLFPPAEPCLKNSDSASAAYSVDLAAYSASIRAPCALLGYFKIPIVNAATAGPAALRIFLSAERWISAGSDSTHFSPSSSSPSARSVLAAVTRSDIWTPNGLPFRLFPYHLRDPLRCRILSAASCLRLSTLALENLLADTKRPAGCKKRVASAATSDDHSAALAATFAATEAVCLTYS